MSDSEGNGKVYRCAACDHKGPAEHFWNLPMRQLKREKLVVDQLLCGKCVRIARGQDPTLWFHRLTATLEFLQKKEEERKERQEAVRNFLVAEKATKLQDRFGAKGENREARKARRREHLEADRQKKCEREEQTAVLLETLGIN